MSGCMKPWSLSLFALIQDTTTLKVGLSRLQDLISPELARLEAFVFALLIVVESIRKVGATGKGEFSPTFHVVIFSFSDLRLHIHFTDTSSPSHHIFHQHHHQACQSREPYPEYKHTESKSHP